MTNKNVLDKTRTYLVGHMQYSDGRNWREHVEKELESLNITVFNPYKNNEKPPSNIPVFFKFSFI